MNRIAQFCTLSLLVTSLSHCILYDGSPTGTRGSSGGSGAGGANSTSAVSSGSSGGGGVMTPIEGGAMVLIGGGARVCSSAAMDNCATAPDFTQQTALPLKKEDLYRMTSDVMATLKKRPELSSTILAKLGAIPANKDSTYDAFLDAIEAAGLSLTTDLPRDSAARAVVLGYAAVAQEEVVDLAHSNLDAAAMFKKLVDFSGGAGAKIGIISSSSEDAKDSYLFYAQVLKQAGAGEVYWIPVDLGYRQSIDQNGCDKLVQNIEEAYLFYGSEVRYPELTQQHLAACKDPKSVLDQINRATGFFFAGGDQAKHKDSLIAGGKESAEMAAIRARIKGGEAAVGGTSAGTSVACGAPMIDGGESYDALVGGSHPVPCTACTANDLIFDKGGGLGFFSYGTLDSHFGQRGRQGRLIRLASDTATKWAFGVDENTALIITRPDTPQVKMEVMGQNGVTILDLTSAGASLDAGGHYRIAGVRASYLRGGDQFSPVNREVAFAASREDIAGKEAHSTPLPPSTDIFGDGVFTTVTQNLCDSAAAKTTGETYETSPLTYEVLFEKGAETRCFAGASEGDVAFVNMLINIEAL